MERTMRPYADERLILQTGQGDIAALQRLFEQVYDAVYCYALSIVCDDWTAKCITEKTFLAVWENAGDYHVETNDALPWILNLCHWQAKTAEPVKSSERKNPFSKRLECPFMNQLLEGLPSRMRQVVILKAVMGLELHEIAKIVGGSVSGTGYRYTHGMIRLERDTSVIKLLSSMEEELCLEASKEIPEMTDGFLRQCEEIPQRRNRSGIIRLSSRLQPLRLAATSVLLLALLGTVGVYHAVNRQRSEITVTTENNMSLSVNGLDRVRSVVADNENKKAGANAAGSTLTEVMTSVTKEELDDESLSSDSNSMLVTVQEDDNERSEQLQKQAVQTIRDTADKKGVNPAVIIQTLSENSEEENGKSALVNELKEALQDCSDQGIEELSIQDLAYLYYRRGLNLESVSLHGVPSEEKYLKGREAGLTCRAADVGFPALLNAEPILQVFEDGPRDDGLLFRCFDFNDSHDSPALKQIYSHNIQNLTKDARGLHCVKGTYRYQGEWDSIDHILSSHALYNKVDTAFVHSPLFLLEEEKLYGGYRPRRTYIGMRHQSGFSDHLPLVVRLNL